MEKQNKHYVSRQIKRHVTSTTLGWMAFVFNPSCTRLQHHMKEEPSKQLLSKEGDNVLDASADDASMEGPRDKTARLGTKRKAEGDENQSIEEVKRIKVEPVEQAGNRLRRQLSLEEVSKRA